MGSLRLGRFEIGERVGGGGMGEVFRAVHTDSGTPAAVKLLTQRLTPASVRAFRDEVRATAAVAHPNVVTVFEHGAVGGDAPWPRGTPWLAMELADASLTGRLPESWVGVRGALIAVLSGLAHTHARGVLHRDLKPDNVLVFDTSAGPAFKVSDYGVARARPGQDADHRIRGTPAFMAPEQVRGAWRDEGPWTDLYALGCMAWALVCGRTPFSGTTARDVARAQITEALPPVVPRLAIPDGLDAWLADLTAKVPRDRYRFAADALAGLLALGDATGSRRAAAQAQPTLTVDTFEFDDDLLGATAAPAWDRPRAKASFPRKWADLDAATAPGGISLVGVRDMPVVGRRAERDALWDALAEVAADGVRRAVVLRGPAGLGKSRLARWLCEHAHETGAADYLVVECSRIPGPHHGVDESLRRALGIVGLAGPEARAQVRPMLGDDPELGDAVVDLAGARAASGEDRRWRTRTVLRALSGHRPLVVWVDAAEWAQEELELVQVTAGLPVLVVFTAQDEAAPPEVDAWLGELPTVAVGRMDPESSERLVAALLGLDVNAAAVVHDRAAGNAAFAIQIVRSWVARGALAPGPHGLQVADRALLTLPDDVIAGWAERIGEFLAGRPTGDELAVELLAALGLRADIGEWERLCASQGVALRAELMDDLIDARLLRRDGDSGIVGLAQGLLVEGIARRARAAGRWRSHHRACAELMTDPQRLGRHLLEAEEWARAEAALVTAAGRAVTVDAYSSARALLADRELALDRMGEPDPSSKRLRSEVWRLRLLRRQGVDIDDRARSIEAIARERKWDLALGLILGLRAQHLTGRRPPDELIAMADESADALRRAGDSVNPFQARLQVALILLASGRIADAASEFDRLLAEHHGDGDALRMGRIQAAIAYRLCGRLADAEALLAGAERRFRELGHNRGLGLVLQQRGHLAYQIGSVDAAVPLWSAALELFRRVGFLHGQSDVLLGLGDAHRHRERWEQAEACFVEARSLIDRIGLPHWFVPAANLGLVRLAAGDAAGAAAVLEEAHAGARAASMVGYVAAIGSARLAALEPSEPGWARLLDETAAGLAETGMADPDILWCLERAASRADACGLPALAERCRDLAAGQARALGRAER